MFEKLICWFKNGLGHDYQIVKVNQFSKHDGNMYSYNTLYCYTMICRNCGHKIIRVAKCQELKCLKNN